MDPGLLAIAERGRRFTAGDYIAAYNARAELHAAMLAFHARYDLLLTPTMPVTALKVGLVVPDDGGFGDDWTRLVALHLSVQPDAAAGRLRALRARPQRPADGRADRRAAAGGRAGAAGGPGGRAGAADAAAARPGVTIFSIDK